jgi:hypothetical protein
VHDTKTESGAAFAAFELVGIDVQIAGIAPDHQDALPGLGAGCHRNIGVETIDAGWILAAHFSTATDCYVCQNHCPGQAENQAQEKPD